MLMRCSPFKKGKTWQKLFSEEQNQLGCNDS